MKKEIKDLIKKEIETKELNLKIFNIVKDHVKKYEGKNYTRRYLSKLTEDITKVFGSAIFKYNGASLDDSLSWKSIKLDLQLNTGYQYNYQLHYDSQNYFTIEEFNRLNKCWSLDVDRIKKLNDLLKDDKTINKISSSIKAINKANKDLCEIFQFGNNACEVEYSLKNLIDVELNKYPKR